MRSCRAGHRSAWRGGRAVTAGGWAAGRVLLLATLLALSGACAGSSARSVRTAGHSGAGGTVTTEGSPSAGSVPAGTPGAGAGASGGGSGAVGGGSGSVGGGSGSVVPGSSGSGTAVSGSAVVVPPAGTGPAPSSATSPPAPRTSTTLAPAPPPGGGAYGLVTAGPTCPVERAGQPCPPAPVRAQVTAETSSGQPAGTTESDSSGRYTLPLPPGTYTLTATTGNTYPRCAPATVTVTAGAATRADISCDSGIR